MISCVLSPDPMKCPLDHIDLRVNDLHKAGKFYRKLLPLLGFGHDCEIEGWIQYSDGAPEHLAQFFGITEDPLHVPNHNRIAFRAPNVAEVNRIADQLKDIGALRIEGPCFESDRYYAVFFDDPCGNKLEICHRTGCLGD